MKLLHVTIRTDKFDEELDFFQKIAGLTIVRDLRQIGEDIVFLSNAAGETDIEVIKTPGAVNSGNDNLSIGFCEDDIAAKREELVKMGMEVTPVISPVPTVQFFFVKDPAGVNIQFLHDGSDLFPVREARE